MLRIQGLTYQHPNRDTLFNNINLTVQDGGKIALIGNNGTGKSTLLRLIVGELKPLSGSIVFDAAPYYLPQHFGQFNGITIAQAMGASQKLSALRKIIEGDLSERNVAVLDDDWTIEERCRQALELWLPEGFDLDTKLESLSGGQKTRVFLAGIEILNPGIILLDEPTNHLDGLARDLLYQFVQTDPRTFIIVSHDRELLDKLEFVCELSRDGIKSYGGNYSFFQEQKLLEKTVLENDLVAAEKALRKAKAVSRETIERQQKLDARGKKKQEKAGIPTIMMNTLRNSAEKTGSRLKHAHSEKIGELSGDLDDLRKKIPDKDQMKLGFDRSDLHQGKRLFKADHLNFKYGDNFLWSHGLDFEIMSGDRIAFTGSNGSGKTTLIRILLGEIEPLTGNIYRSPLRSVYIDQDYSLINNALTVYQQAQNFNYSNLLEHEVKIRLTRFLFDKNGWDKKCIALSGGEKMRLALCCLAISNKAPDIIILDEPTNNLDLQNLEILGAAIRDFKGTLIVVSHDKYFIQEVEINLSMDLDTGIIS